MQDLTLHTPIKTLKDKGRFDSMDRTEIVMWVEDLFGVDLFEVNFSDFSNFQYLLDYVEDRTAKHA